jgi:hypothetical protein
MFVRVNHQTKRTGKEGATLENDVIETKSYNCM